MTKHAHDVPRSTNSNAGTVARAVRLLGSLVDSETTVGVGSLSETMGLPSSTIHRLLRLLADEGMVDRDPETHNYSVGPEMYRIAARVVDQVNIVRIIQPHIDTLAEKFDETVLFAHYSPATKSLAFTARSDGQQLLQYRVDLNRTMSLVWGASGKAVLAYLDESTIRQVLDHERNLPGNGDAPGSQEALPNYEDLLHELTKVRHRGFAVSEGEKLPEAHGIGVPVIGSRGILGSVTLTSPKTRAPHGDTKDIARELRSAAFKISRDLGVPVSHLKFYDHEHVD